MNKFMRQWGNQNTAMLCFVISICNTLSDLHDWSIPSEVCQVSVGSVIKPRYNRQKSKTGSLTNVNETKVALFRYNSDVYAINEKCPHAGKSKALCKFTERIYENVML